MRISFLPAAALLSASFFVVSCEQESVVDHVELESPAPIFSEAFRSTAKTPASLGKRADGYGVSVAMAEYLTAEESGQMGTTVFFNNRGNKRLAYDFNPDLQLDNTTGVSYYVDETRPSQSVPVAASTAAIVRSMNTWDEVQCSDLGMFRVPGTGGSTGLIAAVLGYGGSFDYVADVNQAGWLPAAAFDAIAPDGSQFILGVTFTIQFTDADGNPIDLNNDGLFDVAWREIYYNDNFLWQDGAGPGADIETVSLHEAGHGLSEQHFGKAFRTLSNGKVHFAPRAVMNATYSGVQTTIGQTDNAGHCSLWANWPK